MCRPEETSHETRKRSSVRAGSKVAAMCAQTCQRPERTTECQLHSLQYGIHSAHSLVQIYHVDSSHMCFAWLRIITVKELPWQQMSIGGKC